MGRSDYIGYAKSMLAAMMSTGELEKANTYLMQSVPMFLNGEEEARKEIYDSLFSVVGRGYRTQYQCYDFECVDYDLYRFSDDMPMVRGPRPTPADLISGNYVTIIGAAQLFGRFHSTPVHRMISTHLRMPVLNISIGGAGPDFFLSREHVVAAANRSRLVILQVLSGRSVGCEEYPGERLTAPADRPDAPQRERLVILKEIWDQDRAEAKRLVTKWSTNYVNLYIELVKRIDRPITLVWMSERSPDEWSPKELDQRPKWGRFPQLVSREMVSAIAANCACYIECSIDTGLPYGVTSRVTGKPCPFFTPDGTTAWQNDYYASLSAHVTLYEQFKCNAARLLQM